MIDTPAQELILLRGQIDPVIPSLADSVIAVTGRKGDHNDCRRYYIIEDIFIHEESFKR